MTRSIKWFVIAGFVLATPSAIVAQIPPTNHKPVYVARGPAFSGPHYPNVPYYFWVSAYDPDGDTLTFSWRLDKAIVASGHDSTFTMIFTDPSRTPQRLTCIFSDPYGLRDSTTWTFAYDAVLDEQVSHPRFALHQNYPNPFNPRTTIRFEIPVARVVRLRIFNSLGQELVTLLSGYIDPGSYSISWNANGPSGVYYYLLESGSFAEMRKMQLIK